MGSGFPGSNLYPNRSIWTSTRERAKGTFPSGPPVQDSMDTPHFAYAHLCDFPPPEAEGNPSGSGALAANSEADVWRTGGPWNSEHPTRSVNSSPNRTRGDAAISNGAAFFDHAPSAIGVKKGSFGGSQTYPEDAALYGSPFPQKRSTGDGSHLNPLTAFPQARDPNLASSRQPQQTSPAFQDVYSGHTPSNSIHSQRAPMSNHTSTFSTQSANQRAYNMNNQIDEDLALQFSRRVTLENGGNGTGPFNPASQPFQLNPGSQPWMGESPGPRYESNVEINADSMASQYVAMNRASIDRVSPSPGYRLESGNSPRNYTANPDTWTARPSSRDHRGGEMERRGTTAQHFAPGFVAPYFPSPYTYAGLTSQYANNFVDPYTHQNFRALISGYPIPQVPTTYSLAANLPPAHPSRDQDPNKGARSALLDDFRSGTKSSKRWELKDIYSHLVEFSGDQHGSRFIQQKLETANSDEKDQVFREIEPNSVQLMKDVFGNYVVQKFFEHGNQVQKRILAEKMRGKVVDLSIQVYACRVVQKVWLAP
jgi:mRNA-binding protein PUF3